MNAKIERVNKDIDKTKDKISEYQARLKELEKQKMELENTEIVEAVRGMDIPLNDLPAILKALREQNGAPFTSGQVPTPRNHDFAGTPDGPKSTKTDKEENENE